MGTYQKKQIKSNVEACRQPLNDESKTTIEPCVKIPKNFGGPLLIITGVLLIISAIFFFIYSNPLIGNIFALIAIAGGYPIFKAAILSAKDHQITAQLFATVAVAISVIVGLFYQGATTFSSESLVFYGGTVIWIILAGSILEAWVLQKTQKNLQELISLTPKSAHVLKNGMEQEVLIDEIQIGDEVIVRPGERIPIDGIVVKGYSTVNQAPITGESIPVEKFADDPVYSGTFNQNGVLEIKTQKIGKDTTLGHMIYLIQEAQETRAPIQNIADRVSTFFLPTILIIAFIAGIITLDVVRGVTVLLVACPCALALAVPIAVVGVIGNSGKNAILVKGGTFIEKLKNVDTVVIDKTGTLTSGLLKVTDIKAFNGYTEDQVLERAAIAEKYSEHPIGKAIVKHALDQKITIQEPKNFEIIPGQGVIMEYQSTTLVGNTKLLHTKNIQTPPAILADQRKLESEGKTVLNVVEEGTPIGLIGVADTIRPEAKSAISQLKKLGIKKIIMLTGDNERTARNVAQQTDISEVYAELSPEDKVKIVKKLKTEGHTVAMVGDGINDAPALANADVGIAMGAAGSDTAIETADIALLGDDLLKVPYSIRLSRKAFQKMKLNIAFSFVWNALGIILSIFGIIGPAIAAVFQEAGCISVVVNSTLLIWYK